MINLKNIGYINLDYISEIVDRGDGSYILVMTNAIADGSGTHRITKAQAEAILKFKGLVKEDEKCIF